tara:strand:- start:28 stop:285 length:258 start_codon:yes stop_codon:yes gene_type:complete
MGRGLFETRYGLLEGHQRKHMATKKKTSSKPQLRKNRYSVRCHSYQGGYLMFEGSLTRTEAERIYKECKLDGYTPAIFDGRKKIK